ncbi:hypothetical protein FBF32_00315 [Candidatus Saccharibacteria bacterium oral taxon 488]|nr:hypothetical protein FBF32_00315 [Candidatus Saccharibacteria bacterium oral taxon 488]
MHAVSSELQQYMTGLTNEISRGHFDEAVRLGEKALIMEELHGEGNESLLGEVYRNMAAASDRLGRTDEALEYIDRAYDVHDIAVNKNSEAETLRERSATASYVGIFALKAYLLTDGRDEALADKARLMTRQAALDMAQVNQLSEEENADQYEINMASRWGMVESLVGDKQRGLALAGRAIRLAWQSERDQQKGLTGRDILRARTRAALRGMAAVAVNAASRFGAMRGMAEKIALKTL